LKQCCKFNKILNEQTQADTVSLTVRMCEALLVANTGKQQAWPVCCLSESYHIATNNDRGQKAVHTQGSHLCNRFARCPHITATCTAEVTA
jgi:hypothetical protein